MTILSETGFQIGKNGVTKGVINSISLDLKKHKRVRIHILKSAGRDKKKIKEIAEEIKSKLKQKTEYLVIGFIIILIKQ